METSVNLNLCSSVPQSSALGPFFYILYTAGMLNDFENKIISHAYDTTLYAEVASPYNRINVDNSLKKDLFKI